MLRLKSLQLKSLRLKLLRLCFNRNLLFSYNNQGNTPDSTHFAMAHCAIKRTIKVMMTKQAFTLILVLIINTLNIAAAQMATNTPESKIDNDAKPLTINDAVESCLKNNISVKKGAITLKDLKYKKNTSWNSVSPTIDLTGGYTNDFENETERLTLSGGISLKLTANLGTQIVLATANYNKGLLTYEELLRQIELSVRKSFTQLLYLKDYVTLEEQYLSTAKEQYENNVVKFNKGQMSELDVATSRLNYEKQKPVLLQAQTNYENSIATFKQVIGLEPNYTIEIDGVLNDVLKLKDISFESLPKVDNPAPAVRQAQYDLEIAKATLSNSRASAYSPVITASYQYGKTKTLDTDTVNTTNQISLSAKIPLDGYLPFSAGGVKIASDKKTLETSILALEDAKRTIATNTQNYIRSANLALSQGHAAQENAKLAQQNYNLTRTSYNYGKTDIIALQKASDELLAAQVSVKNAAYNAIAAILDLEYTLGIPYDSLNKDSEY